MFFAVFRPPPRHHPKNNLLVNAPHTHHLLVAEDWDRPYAKEQAFFPLKELFEDKYWPPVGRIDNVAGDRNLVCSCPPMEDYAALSTGDTPGLAASPGAAE